MDGSESKLVFVSYAHEDKEFLDEELLPFLKSSVRRERDLYLDLLLLLVDHNVGSVGLVQGAADTVHELQVHGRSLAVLPCVTLHPGMDGLFPELDTP